MRGIFYVISNLLFLSLGIGGASHCVAQNPAVSPYAIFSENFQPNCSGVLAQYGRLPVLRAAVLWNTFGTNTACYNRMVGMPNFQEVEIHLTNGPCQRNRRCGKYEFVFDPRNPAAFSAYAEDAYRKLIPQLRPEDKCLVSPELEGNQPANVREQMMHLTYSAFKGRCFVVDNPLKGPYRALPGTYFEQHGARPQLNAPCVYNNDGTELKPAAVKQTIWDYAQCEMAAYWVAKDNCNVGSRFIDPRARPTRNCLNGNDARIVVDALLPAFEARPVPGPPALDIRDIEGCGPKQQLPASDGPGNFVFKESETKLAADRKSKAAVVLFPTAFRDPARFRKVYMMNKGRVIDNFYWAYYRTEDGSKRQTWVSHLSPMQIPFYSVLRADSLCWIITNPKVRND